MSSQKIVACFCLILLVSAVAVAQETSNPDSSLQTILNGIAGTPLSLEAAIRHAVDNAVDLQTARASWLASEGARRREAGSFDPQIFFDINYNDQKLPTASFFSGAPILATQTTTSHAGVRMTLPIGTELSLGLNAVSLNTNSTLAFLSPEYDAFGSLSFRQPLLGGLWVSARKNLQQAEHAAEGGRMRYDQQTIAVTGKAEQLYWDLYQAERDFAVQKLTRDRAETFVRETELRAKTGLVGPNQVANAKTFLAQQELQLIDLDELLDQRSDQLASFMGVRPDGGARFRPSDEPPQEFSLAPVDSVVSRAVAANLELSASKEDIEAAKSLADAAGWEALPNLNLTGSIGGNGLGGTGQVVSILSTSFPVPPTRSLGDAFDQITHRYYPTWGIGLELTVPIGLRSGLGEKDRLDAQVSLAELSYTGQRRALEEQVRAAYREVAHGKSRTEAARGGVDAAQEQVRIGMIEFRNGRSTAFELVRLGEDLAVAQRRYSEALVRTANAAVALRVLTSGGAMK